MRTLSCSAPAKINLTLKIGKKNKKGFHKITTTMQTISLHDTITISVQESEKNEVLLYLKNINNFPVPADEKNMAVQAATVFLKNASLVPQKITITLQKNIPVCAGLGGGSSNAATVLQALSQLFPSSIPQNIHTLAHQLGSDVPFFFSGFSAAKVSGTGEHIEKISPQYLGKCLLVQPKNVSYSTASAYTKWDIFSQKNKNSISLHTKNISNDFQTVLLPEFLEFQKIEKIFSESSAKRYGLCGSGSAWYAFFSSALEMKKIAETYNKDDFLILIEA